MRGRLLKYLIVLVVGSFITVVMIYQVFTSSVDTTSVDISLPALDTVALHPGRSARVISEQRNKKSPSDTLDCKGIISGDKAAIKNAGFSTFHPLNEGWYIDSTKDCQNFLSTRGYVTGPVSKEEDEFPIAFSILVYENVEQVERLLRSIYRENNMYCIHIDSKSDTAFKTALSKICNCFPNVFLSSKSSVVHWGQIGVLYGELNCMVDLWRNGKQWKYLINLTGKEFPLVTNKQLVSILKTLNGRNNIDGSTYNLQRNWFEFVWTDPNTRTSKRKPPPPHGILIRKGSTHLAASRVFVEFVLHDKRARDFLAWCRDIRVPDEHFFSSLNHNPHLNVPGQYNGDIRHKRDDFFIMRHKVWQVSNYHCKGRWVRWICNFDLGDLKYVIASKKLFVNKFDLEMSPAAYQCMEEWLHNKTLNETEPDLYYYRKRTSYSG